MGESHEVADLVKEHVPPVVAGPEACVQIDVGIEDDLAADVDQLAVLIAGIAAAPAPCGVLERDRAPELPLGKPSDQDRRPPTAVAPRLIEGAPGGRGLGRLPLVEELDARRLTRHLHGALDVL